MALKVDVMNQTEFETLLTDNTKRIAGDISWEEDEDHSPAVEFRVEADSDAGYPIFIKGSYNALAGTLSYTLIHRGSGGIYALDLVRITTIGVALTSEKSTSIGGTKLYGTAKPMFPLTSPLQ